MEEHNRKKEEKEKRDIAELKAARENAERKLAALMISTKKPIMLEFPEIP